MGWNSSWRFLLYVFLFCYFLIYTIENEIKKVVFLVKSRSRMLVQKWYLPTMWARTDLDIGNKKVEDFWWSQTGNMQWQVVYKRKWYENTVTTFGKKYSTSKLQKKIKQGSKLINNYGMKNKPHTVFPHIVAATTILFWKLECGKYSREETNY